MRKNRVTEQRIYLGGYEIYRRYNGRVLEFERQTLHVMDDQQRVAMVETLTVSGATDVDPATPRIRYALEDHLGTATLELDDTGAIISYEEYHPFGSTAWWAGEATGEVSRRRYRYTGKEKDEETGLYYHGARYYAPWLGRWCAADPVGLADGPNRYAYVGNQPIVLIDPTGRSKEKRQARRRKKRDKQPDPKLPEAKSDPAPAPAPEQEAPAPPEPPTPPALPVLPNAPAGGNFTVQVVPYEEFTSFDSVRYAQQELDFAKTMKNRNLAREELLEAAIQGAGQIDAVTAKPPARIGATVEHVAGDRFRLTSLTIAVNPNSVTVFSGEFGATDPDERNNYPNGQGAFGSTNREHELAHAAIQQHILGTEAFVRLLLSGNLEITAKAPGQVLETTDPADFSGPSFTLQGVDIPTIFTVPSAGGNVHVASGEIGTELQKIADYINASGFWIQAVYTHGPLYMPQSQRGYLNNNTVMPPPPPPVIDTKLK